MDDPVNSMELRFNNDQITPEQCNSIALGLNDVPLTNFIWCKFNIKLGRYCFKEIVCLVKIFEIFLSEKTLEIGP